MLFSNSKFLGLIFILSITIIFNYAFFQFLKEKTDFIYNNYIIQNLDKTAKEDLSKIMKKSSYSKNDLELMANISFKSYKETIKKREFLGNDLKNIILLNIKTVIYDNNNFYFGINYIFNLTAFTAFFFILIFNDKYLGVRHAKTSYS